MKTRFQVWVEEKKYDELKSLAEKKGMAVSEYVRDILERAEGSEFTELTIDFADIDKFVLEIEDLRKKIETVLPNIYRTGKVYEEDAHIIKQTLNKIDSKCDDIWKYITAVRSNLYDDTKKKLYQGIRRSGHSTRHNRKVIEKFENGDSDD